MGISGLLPLIKEALIPVKLDTYRDKTLAVDAYVWLHRGVYSCAQDLATGKQSTKYVSYCMGRVHMLQHFGVKPYIVFDGSALPSKRGTEEDRATRRADALKKANSFLAAGKNEAARDEFAKAVDVTPAMAYQFIKALKKANIPYVVAPYEADAQLAFLERQGIVDGIISEDSDLVVFGCNTVLFKMDQAGGVVEYKRERLTSCTEYRFHDWTEERFRHMAILSGCDYLDGLDGLGLKTAHQLFYKYKAAPKVIEQVKLAGKVKVPRSYLGEFQRANLTFLHQRVFDPNTREAVHLTALPPKGLPEAMFEAVGGLMTSELALGIALGDIDPSTGEAMIDICPVEPSSVYTPTTKGKQLPTSFYKPKEPKPTVSNGPLDAFFGRRPSTPLSGSAAKPKRPALGNVKINESRRLSPTKPIIHSRHFGSTPISKPPAKVEVRDDGPDGDEMAAMMECEAVAERPAPVKREAPAVKEGPILVVKEEAMLVVEETDLSPVALDATSEPALDLPTSELMMMTSPSPRRKRRLVEESELMDVKSSPSSIKAAVGGVKEEPGSPALFGSPISSPVKDEHGTPTKRAIQDWRHRFSHSSSNQKVESAPLPIRKPSSPLRTSSSTGAQICSSPQRPSEKPVARAASPSKPLKRKDSPTDFTAPTTTSRERPLSSFMYTGPKRPRT